MTLNRFLKKLLSIKHSNKFSRGENKKFTDLKSTNQLVSTTTTIINRKKVSKIVKSQVESQFSLFKSKSSAMSKITQINHTIKLRPEKSNRHVDLQKMLKSDSLCKKCLHSKIIRKNYLKYNNCKCCGRIIREKIINKNMNMKAQNSRNLSRKKSNNHCKNDRIEKLLITARVNHSNILRKKNLIVYDNSVFMRGNYQNSLCRQYISNSEEQPCCLINGKPLRIRNSISLNINNNYDSFTNFNKKKLQSHKEKTTSKIIYPERHIELKKFKGMVNILSSNINIII